MYSLDKLYVSFINKTNELVLLFDRIVSQPKSLERDLLIEALFLKIVIHWENFLEEYFLSCLCRGRSKSGKIIKPIIPAQRNKNAAFKRLTPNRGGRESEYLDWLDFNKLKNRCNDYFHHRSRIHFIYAKPELINQIQIIRNHIAHNSYKSLKKFREKIISSYGYLPVVDADVVDVLVATNRETSRYFYNYYISQLFELAKYLTK